MAKRELRTRIIPIRITDAEYREFERFAELSERSISDAVRRLVLKEVKRLEQERDR